MEQTRSDGELASNVLACVQLEQLGSFDTCTYTGTRRKPLAVIHRHTSIRSRVKLTTLLAP